MGEILVCNMSGEFVILVPDSPGLRTQDGLRIECITSYSRGLILAGEEGMIFAFEATSNESQIYRPQ